MAKDGSEIYMNICWRTAMWKEGVEDQQGGTGRHCTHLSLMTLSMMNLGWLNNGSTTALCPHTQTVPASTHPLSHISSSAMTNCNSLSTCRQSSHWSTGARTPLAPWTLKIEPTGRWHSTAHQHSVLLKNMLSFPQSNHIVLHTHRRFNGTYMFGSGFHHWQNIAVFWNDSFNYILCSVLL